MKPHRRATLAIAVALVLGRPGQLSAGVLPFGGAVNFEQRIGETLPLEVKFADTAGRLHALGDYFHGKPVVLYFGYARCPQLCGVVADGTVAALRQLRPEVGRDFAVVSISIDPTETVTENAHRLSDAVHRYGRPGDAANGWHYLTGSEEAIRAVTAAAGFRYTFDARSRQYAHPSGFFIATPDGRISAYFLGVVFSASDVAQALGRAGEGGASSPVVQLLLLCFRGDGITGRYGPLIWRALIVAVVLTVLGVGGGIGWMLREERRAGRQAQEGPA
jgi:protein SCO1/2